jgi:hypothetical protein
MTGVTVDADNDHKLLSKLIEQGGRKYTAGNIDRRKYERLALLWQISRFGEPVGIPEAIFQ